MIHSVLIINSSGKCRLQYFASSEMSDPTVRSGVTAEVHCLIMNGYRSDSTSNFIRESDKIRNYFQHGKMLTICFRKYATLYFVAIVDENESKLAIIDFIQLFVRTLDRVFPDISELDIVYNYDKILLILEEMIQGGLLLETSMETLQLAIEQQHIVLDGRRRRSIQVGGLTNMLSRAIN